MLGPDSSQRQVFEGTVSPLVRGVLEGRDAVVFTYGVTNAGKTFTFLGQNQEPNSVLEPNYILSSYMLYI